MDRKRALTSETLTRVFSDLDDDKDGELGPRVFCSALQARTSRCLGSLLNRQRAVRDVSGWCLAGMMCMPSHP